MRSKATIIAMTMAVLGYSLLTGCRPKNYTITVSGDAIKDGDTLYLTDNLRQLTPIDTAVTVDGKAVFRAPTDSTFMALVYKSGNNNIGATLFVGQGEAIVFLSKNAGESKVAGAEINERWREMNDSIYKITIRLNTLADQLNKTEMPYQKQKKYIERMKACNSKLKTAIINYARENIDNELGCFILIFYDDIIPPDVRDELISQLPQGMHNRAAIRQLSKEAKESQQTRTKAVTSPHQRQALRSGMNQ